MRGQLDSFRMMLWRYFSKSLHPAYNLAHPSRTRALSTQILSTHQLNSYSPRNSAWRGDKMTERRLKPKAKSIQICKRIWRSRGQRITKNTLIQAQKRKDRCILCLAWAKTGYESQKTSQNIRVAIVQASSKHSVSLWGNQKALSGSLKKSYCTDFLRWIPCIMNSLRELLQKTKSANKKSFLKACQFSAAKKIY